MKNLSEYIKIDATSETYKYAAAFHGLHMSFLFIFRLHFPISMEVPESNPERSVILIGTPLNTKRVHKLGSYHIYSYFSFTVNNLTVTSHTTKHNNCTNWEAIKDTVNFFSQLRV